MSNGIDKICPYCRTAIGPDEEAYICSRCSIPHHKECWQENDGCTTFGCDGIPDTDDFSPNTSYASQEMNPQYPGSTGDIYCGSCGNGNSRDAKFCIRCGAKLAVSSAEPSHQSGHQAPPSGYRPLSPDYPPTAQGQGGVPPNYQQGYYVEKPIYAGFWLRFWAALVDGLVMMPVGWILGSSDMGWLLGAIVGWLYFALMESSAKRATLGKMALGLEVVDYGGNQISFGKATGRYFSKLISSFILLIGYIMAAFTEQKQGLHDIMAGTLVVRKGAFVPQNNYQYRG